jgi:hypothetical protein
MIQNPKFLIQPMCFALAGTIASFAAGDFHQAGGDLEEISMALVGSLRCLRLAFFHPVAMHTQSTSHTVDTVSIGGKGI